jgi:hypothetical protein
MRSNQRVPTAPTTVAHTFEEHGAVQVLERHWVSFGLLDGSSASTPIQRSTKCQPPTRSTTTWTPFDETYKMAARSNVCPSELFRKTKKGSTALLTQSMLMKECVVEESMRTYDVPLHGVEK